MSDAAYSDDFFDERADEALAGAPCRHWQGRAACAETCACGHGCADHHEAGWCARCGCVAWTDALGADILPLPAASADDWDLADVFDDDYDEAAGW